jgi:hypothetical protein
MPRKVRALPAQAMTAMGLHRAFEPVRRAAAGLREVMEAAW